MNIVAVDPAAHGRKASAYAVMEEGEVVACGYTRDVRQIPLAEGVRYTWAFEKPQKYKRFGQAHKALDRLNAVVKRWARFAKDRGDVVEMYTPHQWKGNVPKTVFQKRIFPVLTEAERLLMPHPREDDVWDAVGIALVASGRLRRGGR